MTPRAIEIVGGGLAGLSLGVALRQHGVPVTLHEAGDYPRHRVCGEFITGLSRTTMRRLGLEPALAAARQHREVAWFTSGGPPQIQRLPSPALGISRHALDATLAATFVTLGGVLHTRSRVVTQVDVPGRIFTNGRRRATASPWVGLKVHVRRLLLCRDLEMHVGRECYVGLTRVESDVVNVCGLFRRGAFLGRGAGILLAALRARGLSDLADRLTSSKCVEDSFCAVAGLEFDRRVRTGDRLCLGDATAMVPPFTGNGMAMALQSAESALGPLLAYAEGAEDWTTTCRVVERVLRSRFRVRLASAGLLHSFLLRPRPPRWLAGLVRARLLPFGPLYSSLH